MQKVRLLLALACSAIVQIAGGNQSAQAQYLRCASEKLGGNDLGASRRAIKLAAGRRAILWGSGWACSNADFARTNVNLAPEPQPDGSVIEPTVFCQRRYVFWKCEVTDNRYFDVSLALADRQPRIKVHLPAKFDVNEVRPLFLRALELAPHLLANQECGLAGKTGGDLDELVSLQTALAFESPNISASIEDEKGEISVQTDDHLMIFTRNAQQPAQFDFKCWSYWIIIT